MNPIMPPLHVAIAASLALMAGVYSLVGFIAGFLSGHPSFDVGMFAILFGWGLLCGKGGMRNWMVVVSAMAFLANFIPPIVITCLQVFGKEPWLPLDTPRDLISSAIIAIVSLYSFLVLLPSRHKEWFRGGRDVLETQSVTAGARLVAFPVLAASLVLSVFLHLHQWWSDETLLAAYPVKVRIITYDEETGKELPPFAYLWPQEDPGGKPVKLPRYNLGKEVRLNDFTTSYESGIVNAVLNRPFEFEVSSGEEYEKATVKLDRNSPAEIRVPLKRKK